MKPLFITGIGTDVGKTIVSAILVEKLKADYWKPIQSGDLDNSDSLKVKRLISNKTTLIHPEKYRLNQPFSPHKSSEIDGISIELENILSPKTLNTLIIEGAGGLMVPLNKHKLIIDLIQHLEAEVILVSRNYLGSINHTLLSIELLKQRNTKIKGLIFNGLKDDSSENLISSYSDIKVLGRIPKLEEVNPFTIKNAGELLNF